jgi:small subunit ribosomal protein S20
MANTPSAKKMTRKIAKRTAVNRMRRTRMRTFIRKVEEAIASGDAGAASQYSAQEYGVPKGFAPLVAHQSFVCRRGLS